MTEPIVQIRTPEELAAGVYANGCAVWSSPSEFSLEFLVSLPVEQGVHPQTQEPVLVAPQQLVARVKIPPPLVFQLMKNLNSALTQYEAENGSIPEFNAGRRPAGDDAPPTGGDEP